MEPPAAEQKFTGLTFSRDTGRIALSRERMWKIRLALMEVATRKVASGDELQTLLGHYCWAALLRRPLLSIF